MWALECQYTWKWRDRWGGVSLGRYKMRHSVRDTEGSRPKARFPLWIGCESRPQSNSEMSITSVASRSPPRTPDPHKDTLTLPFCSLRSRLFCKSNKRQQKLTACASSSSNLRSSRVQSVSSGRSRSQTTLFTLATTVLSARPWLQTENNPGAYLTRLVIKNYWFSERMKQWCRNRGIHIKHLLLKLPRWRRY